MSAASTVDVGAEWAAVATVMHQAPPVAAPRTPAATREANLALVMRSPSSRRDLRRLLMVIGAIRGHRPDPDRPRTAAIRTSQIVAALMAGDAGLHERLIRSAGTIVDEDRIRRFATGIAAAGERAQPADAESVAYWVAEVARVLREDVTHAR